MTSLELGQNLLKQAEMFKGDVWYSHYKSDGTRRIGLEMDITFQNIGQATMFAQFVIWNNQVQAYVIGGDWDDPTQKADVRIISGISTR